MTGTTTLLLITIVILIAIVLKGWYDLEKQELIIEEQERTIHGLKMTIDVLKKRPTK